MYDFGDEELEALKKLFAKKKFYRYHPKDPTECDLFEAEFSQWMGSSHALLLTSGTNALLAALMSVGIAPGDEVLIPTYTFIATAAAVVQAGAIPILVNIDDNLGMDAQDAKSKITSRTKAIIPVHMDGLAANMDALLALAQAHQLHVIEDVAQAVGGSYKGKALGSMGTFGCYSFNENKNISCGEGGALITRDRKLYEKAFCLHDAPVQFSPSRKDFFQEITPFLGFSMRVSEIQGTLMRVQLSRLDTILKSLRERKAIYVESLLGLKDVRVPQGHCAEGDCASSLHLQFSDPIQAMAVGKTLREAGALFAPVTTRPAHAGWKWMHLFADHAHIQMERNPFLQSETKYNYVTSDYLQSIEVLTKTVKMDLNIDMTLEETRKHAQLIREKLL